jgi:hypothetical protein
VSFLKSDKLPFRERLCLISLNLGERTSVTTPLKPDSHIEQTKIRFAWLAFYDPRKKTSSKARVIPSSNGRAIIQYNMFWKVISNSWRHEGEQEEDGSETTTWWRFNHIQLFSAETREIGNSGTIDALCDCFWCLSDERDVTLWRSCAAIWVHDQQDIAPSNLSWKQFGYRSDNAKLLWWCTKYLTIKVNSACQLQEVEV